MIYLYFNSIKVQLERLSTMQILVSLSDFNSIKVQLERFFTFIYDSIKNFNSIKVQLELDVLDGE